MALGDRPMVAPGIMVNATVPEKKTWSKCGVCRQASDPTARARPAEFHDKAVHWRPSPEPCRSGWGGDAEDPAGEAVVGEGDAPRARGRVKT